MLTVIRAMLAGVPRWVWLVLAGLLLLRLYGDHRAREARAQLRQQHAVEIAQWRAHVARLEEAALAARQAAAAREAAARSEVARVRAAASRQVAPTVRRLREYRAAGAVCTVPPEIEQATAELARRPEEVAP